MTEVVPALSWFFLFAFALNGLLAIAILIFKNKTLRTANTLLAINLLGISIGAIMISLVQSRMILEVPHFYRTASPLAYLMFPAAYLYVKLILKDQTRLDRRDYLHALPACIHLVEMLPYYLLTREEKVNHIMEVLNQNIQLYAHNEGWLPPYVHGIIRAAMAVIYSIAIYRLILKSEALHPGNIRHTLTTFGWLKSFTIVNASIGVVAMIFILLVFLPDHVRSLAIHSIFLIALLITNFYLFFKPEILYGLPQPVLNSGRLEVPPTHPNPMETPPAVESREAAIPPFIYLYKDQVHQYLAGSQSYLKPDFMLMDLSRETGIPKHHLQLLIHKVDGMKFNEFINDFRIQYMRQQVDKGALKSKTLEGLASESGFSSRATFSRAVKKQTGKTPSEFFANQEEIRIA